MADDTLTIVGKSNGIKEKTQGWHEVEVVVPGKQYPYRLATKSSSLLDGVRALQGGVGTFHYVERESTKINPNTGNPYMNRYLESVEAGAAAGAQQAAAPSGGGTSGQMTNEDWLDKERRDFRSRAWGMTTGAFQHTIKPDEDPAAVFARLAPFQKLIYKDIVQEIDKNEQQALPVSQHVPPPAASADGYEPTPDPDDDIPF